jgi:hypothetical protein
MATPFEGVSAVEAGENRPYRCRQQGDRYRVEDAGGNCVMECADRLSAEHYADLLGKAYASGYKAGYRAARA